MNTVKDILSTAFEREKVLNFLDQLVNSAYNPSIDVKSYISQNIESPKAEFISAYVTQNGADAESISSRVKQLRVEIEGLPVITLTLPFTPDEQLASKIAQQTREITGTPAIVDFKLEPLILGGAIVEGNGKVGEYSFRRYFQMRKEKNGL